MAGLPLRRRGGITPMSSTPIVDVRDHTPPVEERKGLWHRLPFFGKRK